MTTLLRTDTLELPVLEMRCGACAARIEKALAQAPGVARAGVNFATAEYDPSASDPTTLREIVRGQGFDAVLPDPAEDRPPDAVADDAAAAEYRRLCRRLIVAAGLTVPVVIPAMGPTSSLVGTRPIPGSSWP